MASRMLDEYTVKISNHFTRFSAINDEFKIIFMNSEISCNFFFLHFCKLFPKLMIELKKKLLAKSVDLGELYTKILLIFQFDTLFIELLLFAFGQYFYRFSRISALL